MTAAFYVQGIRYQVQGIRYQVQGIRYQVQGSWMLDVGRGPGRVMRDEGVAMSYPH